MIINIIITTINMTMVTIILAHFAAIEVTDSIVHFHPTLLVPVQPSQNINIRSQHPDKNNALSNLDIKPR